MANDFYTFTPEFMPGTRVRAGDVNIQYAAIEDAFDLLEASNPLTPLGTNAFTTETGTTNGYVVAMPTTRTTEADGDMVVFIATHTNTAAATLEVDGLGSKSIVNSDGSAVEAGDLTNGLIYTLRYDATNTRYQLMSVVPSQIAAGSDAVTLTGQDYLTLSNQQITVGKIALDDLADGTDGELITWDAAGAPAAVPVGTADFVLTSNGAGAAPTFQEAGLWTIETFTDNYTLVAADKSKLKKSTKATAVNLTVAPDIFAEGNQVTIYQSGAGQITLVAGAGVTIRTPSTLTFNEQYGSVTLICLGSNEWFIAGRMTPA